MAEIHLIYTNQFHKAISQKPFKMGKSQTNKVG